jgi:hypothetical protein
MESINDDFYGEIIELAKAIKEQIKNRTDKK